MKKNDLNALKTAALEEMVKLTGDKKGDRKSQSRQSESLTYLQMTLKKIDLVEKAEGDILRWCRDLEEYVKRLGNYGIILYREDKKEEPELKDLPGVKTTLKEAPEKAAKAPRRRRKAVVEGQEA